MNKATSGRIKKEKARLWTICKDIPEEKKGIVDGLVDRAAWMRVQLEDLEEDLLENGWTELFQQSTKTDPYDRARPAGQTYQSLNVNYQKIIKQLTTLIPKSNAASQDDAFDLFVVSRDD